MLDSQAGPTPSGSQHTKVGEETQSEDLQYGIALG